MSEDAAWTESMPEIYDRCLGPALFAPFAARIAAMAAALSPSRVLEIAAGTGVATAELVRALPSASITATDLNPAMVAWAAQRVSGPVWLTADAERLDFPDDSFDLVVCQFGVMFFPDKPAAFAEVARVLAPGGVLLFTVWDAVAGSDFPAALVAGLASVLPVDPPDFIVRVPHGYSDVERIRADLLAGGLSAVAVDRVVLRGRAASAQVLADGYCGGTPLRFALERRGSLASLTRDIGAEMTRRLGSGEVAGDLIGLVVTSIR
ncbi:MAG: ubiE 4 [Frankiales bacterium]|nr:ubiE 4 [Frankiales bacterium]